MLLGSAIAVTRYPGHDATRQERDEVAAPAVLAALREVTGL